MRHVETAGIPARTIAATIDTVLFLLQTVPLMGLAYGEQVARFDDLRPWSLVINWLLPFVVAMGFWSTFGATPGKMFMSLTIVDDTTGRPAALGRCVLRWLGYLLSALPFGLGFLWAAIDSDKQGWHDKLAGTRVVRRRRAAAGCDEPGGYLASHWRGELPLPVSFWVNNILLSLPFGFALNALTAWISLKGERLQTSSMAALVGWPLMLAMNAWCIVGAWRAATAYGDRGGSPLWSGATKCVLFLAASSTLSSTVLDFAPQVGAYMQMARGVDPIGQVQLLLSPNGRSLKLTGPVGMGDATRVRQMIGAAGEGRLIELESPGGRVYEADLIAAMVRHHGWQTRATGDCESACTLIFMAGATRQLMPGAKLGFHRAFAGSFNPVLDQLANRELARMYRSAGLPEDFITQTMHTPPWTMWHPGLDQLAQGGLITAPHWTLDVELPPRAASAPSDMADALRASQVWHALEQRFPGSITTAAGRMSAARLRSASDGGVLTEGQRVAEVLLRRLLRDASPQALERFLPLLTGQLRAARLTGGSACGAVLAGDARARRGLPQALVLLESEWMVAVASEPLGGRRSHAATALELEVIRRTLGDAAPARLAGLWAPGRASGAWLDCDSSIALLDTIAGLHDGQRRLALRLVFQRP